MQNTLFKVLGASVVGGRHLSKQKNNQDSFKYISNDDYIIAVVADGCGSSMKAEVGAILGCEWVCGFISEYLNDNISIYDFWPKLKNDILCKIESVVGDMSGEAIDNIIEKFLFTIVGCVITPEKTCVFNIGDGVYFVNDDMHNLGPFPYNAPPFIAYGCIDSGFFTMVPNNGDFDFNLKYYNTEGINSILIGTYGVLDLIEFAGKYAPGTNEPIDNISKLWSSDTYFQKPNSLYKKLSMLNVDQKYKDEIGSRQIAMCEGGPLHDDTTMIVLKRR